MRFFVATFALNFALVFGAGVANAQTLLIYSESLNLKSIQALLEESPLAPDQNIRAIVLHKTERASFHLVQIRDREKPHIHQTHDLFVVLQRGGGILNIGNETVTMKVGDSVFIPQGTPHYFVNTGEEVTVALGVFSPPYAGKDSVPAGTSFQSP